MTPKYNAVSGLIINPQACPDKRPAMSLNRLKSELIKPLPNPTWQASTPEKKI